MITLDAEKLFDIVKRDDVKQFGEIRSPELFSCRFGRFPLLSALYLFDAKRIVRKYYDELVKERPATRCPAVAAADALFASKGGKALRYYREKEVSPLEMLAILGETRELKKLYKCYPAPDRYLPAIHKIYFTRVGEGVAQRGNELILPKEPMSYLAGKLMRVASLVFSVLFVLSLAITLAVAFAAGFGTESRPYTAETETELRYAAAQEGYVSLKKDVYLTEPLDEVKSKIVGNDKKIYLTSAFAKVFTGTLSDVTFVLEEGYAAEAVIGTNRGTLSGVSVVTADLTFDKADFVKEASETDEETTRYLSLFTERNEGVIENSYAVLTLTIAGTGGGNCYFASFAGENAGTIHNCNAQGALVTTAVDISGIACKNAIGGIITDCTSSVALAQRTTITGWNPTVSGIVGENNGIVYGCVNAGKLTSEIALTQAAERTTAAIVAGIVASNTGSVKNCVNTGDLLANATFGYAFAAGIAYTHEVGEASESLLSNNVSKGKIEAKSTSAEAWAVGIVKDNYSDVESCRNEGVVLCSVSLEEKNADVSAYAAGVAGINVGTITSSANRGEIVSSGENVAAYAGGIAVWNTYTKDNRHYGRIEGASGEAPVSALSVGESTYAGGIVARNHQNVWVVGCRQTADVMASSEVDDGSDVLSFMGGIVGYNLGYVETSFYTGKIPVYDKKNFAGGICGLTYIFYSINLFTGKESFTISLGENAYVGGETDYAIGSVISQGSYNSIRAGYVYGAAQLSEMDVDYNAILNFEATKVADINEMKELDIYFE